MRGGSLCSPLRDRALPDELRVAGQVDRYSEPRHRAAVLQQRLKQRDVSVRGFDENLRLVFRFGFQRTYCCCALFGGYRQVTDKTKVLTVKAARHQCQDDRRRAH